MSTQEAIQKNTREIDSLQREVRGLHTKVRLSALRDRVEDVESTAKGFAQRVADIRNRKYAFGMTLADQGKDLAARWRPIRMDVQKQINLEARKLERSVNPIESRMTRLEALKRRPSTARPQITRLKSEINNLESKISAADSTISGMFDRLEEEVNEFNGNLNQIEEMLDELAEASFSLTPTEAGILAVEATFVEGKEDKNDPKGIFFLTDQRVIFERKQEVAKKKVLFVTTEKEMVQELLFETALGHVEEITASKRGLFKNEDHLEIKFGRGASLNFAHLHLDGQDCEMWKATITRAIAGEFDQDRAIEVEEEVVEKMRDVPTECTGCGAGLTQKVLRGMDSITCEYCGTVMRI
jgi:predicted  nucleic acid-binding Zn-ribbon protein